MAIEIDAVPFDPETGDAEELARALSSASLHVHGQLVDSSNAALVVTCEVSGSNILAVYKPVAGERPLWDFPDGTLAHREVATSEVARALSWDCIPITVWREDGPAGPGMCEQWIDTESHPAQVDVFAPDKVPDGWFTIVTGVDGAGADVCVAHADTEQLRRLALFDALVNNADRKAGHILATPAGGLFGIDHGVTFNEHEKLRTVLWGFAGREVSAQLLGELDVGLELLESDLGRQLADHLTPDEIAATQQRARRLLKAGTFPLPSRDWPAIPWPVI